MIRTTRIFLCILLVTLRSRLIEYYETRKGAGQPFQSEIDSILQSHGTNRAAQFGGAHTGNGCRKLMAKADAIMKEIGHYVYLLPIEQCLVGTQDAIQAAVCEYHRQLLLCLDRYFSGLRTKRYHLTNEITMNTILYRNRSWLP
jgi:hypothetical protein